MTLFMVDIFRKSNNQDIWDGLKPPAMSISTLYYNLKWNNELYKIDKLPISKRLFFAFLKFIQLFAYIKGWNTVDSDKF